MGRGKKKKEGEKRRKEATPPASAKTSFYEFVSISTGG